MKKTTKKYLLRFMVGVLKSVCIFIMLSMFVKFIMFFLFLAHEYPGLVFSLMVILFLLIGGLSALGDKEIDEIFKD